MNELASVMDTVALPVFALDADAYYVYENEQAQDFLGYDPMAITEKHITDLIVYDPELLIAAFAASSAGDTSAVASSTGIGTAVLLRLT